MGSGCSGAWPGRPTVAARWRPWGATTRPCPWRRWRRPSLAAGADLVLGPSRDGGYYLIALTARSGGALRRELFEGIAWSTDRVLGETLERAASLGLRTELLDEGTDVDTPEDLRRLAAELAEDPEAAALCPRTRTLLSAWGYLSPAAREAS